MALRFAFSLSRLLAVEAFHLQAEPNRELAFMSMKILGLSFDFHDAAAALIDDSGVIAAVQEERFSRKKNDPGLPVHAFDYCLKQAGISAQQLDYVVFYEKPLLKFDRILRCSLGGYPRTSEYLFSTLAAWVHKRKLFVAARIAEALHIPRSRIRFIKHHYSHAASAFFLLPL